LWQEQISHQNRHDEITTIPVEAHLRVGKAEDWSNRIHRFAQIPI
jgi:hypothetical protein